MKKNTAIQEPVLPSKEKKVLGVRGLSAIATRAQILKAAIDVFSRFEINKQNFILLLLNAARFIKITVNC